MRGNPADAVKGIYYAYNFLLFVVLIVFSPVWLFALAIVPKFRAGFWEKCGRLSPAFLDQLSLGLNRQRIWIHAVSVGELNAARPLIDALKARDYTVIISTTTGTGQALAQKQLQDTPLFYFPFDLPWIMSRTLDRLKPDQILIMETEIWPNLLHLAFQRNIPVRLVNGRLSPSSFGGYRRFKWFFQPVLNLYSSLLMQSEADAERMVSLGAKAENVINCGNIKFDNPLPQDQTDDPSRLGLLQGLFQLAPQTPVIIFASTHAGEDDLFLKCFLNLQRVFPPLVGIFAPRHPERFQSVAVLFESKQISYLRRSELNDAARDSNVILLDTVGELAIVYGLGTVACVGGSFVPTGGHNPLEALRAKIPVVYGPYMFNFETIGRSIIEAQAGYQADSIDAAQTWIEMILQDTATYRQTVANGQALLAKNQGALDKILAYVIPSLKPGDNL